MFVHTISGTCRRMSRVHKYTRVWTWTHVCVHIDICKLDTHEERRFSRCVHIFYFTSFFRLALHGGCIGCAHTSQGQTVYLLTWSVRIYIVRFWNNVFWRENITTSIVFSTDFHEFKQNPLFLLASQSFFINFLSTCFVSFLLLDYLFKLDFVTFLHVF